jgi:hypothetical protein
MCVVRAHSEYVCACVRACVCVFVCVCHVCGLCGGLDTFCWLAMVWYLGLVGITWAMGPNMSLDLAN